MSAAVPPEIPLCVDLDGTLTPCDTTWELVVALVRHRPWRALGLPWWVRHGWAGGKARLAREVSLGWARLPWTESLLDFLRAEKAAGRRLVLVTGADRQVADAVAQELGLFDETIASDGETNLVAKLKAEALLARFGRRGFDYAGNSFKDVAIWRECRLALPVNCPPAVLRRCREVSEVAKVLHPVRRGLPLWSRALRAHQWTKNLLVVVPLLSAHEFTDPAKSWQVARAFSAFSLAASAIYLINDLLDLESDRQHATKRRRALAQGALGIPAAFGASALCAAIALALACTLPPAFGFCLAGYFLLTSAYSFYLKRLELLDVVTLALLYGLRVLAGGAAAGIPLSYWLLVFCLFNFLSLAFIKRYTELITTSAESLAGRGYETRDAPIVSQMGIASGYLAALVLALYVASPAVTQLYRRPSFLWPLCIAYAYWISRAWLLTHRGRMRDDPVVFALRDPMSYVAGGALLIAAWLARPIHAP
jgi:4-hydroxybenzoate polyprenyltransferase